MTFKDVDDPPPYPAGIWFNITTDKDNEKRFKYEIHCLRNTWVGFAYGKDMSAGTDMLRISCPDVKDTSGFKVEDLYANGNWDATGPTPDLENDYTGTTIVET